MSTIRYRWSGDPDAPPSLGCYLMARRGRGGYLILGVKNKGRRGGLGEPVYLLLVLTVERVSRAEAAAAPPERLFNIVWDSRGPKRRSLGAVTERAEILAMIGHTGFEVSSCLPIASREYDDGR